MKPYIEAELHDLLESLDVEGLSFEEAYLLLKQKIKEKQIPVEIYHVPEILDSNAIWVLDVSELQKPIKLAFEGEPPIADMIEGWWDLA